MSSLRSGTDTLTSTGLDPEAATALIAAAGDVSLFVDAQGVVRDVAVSDTAKLLDEEAQSWVGRPFVDTVTPETRGKVEALLRDVAATGVSRRRQVNHLSTTGPDVPVAYTAVRMGSSGGSVVMGRDMRTIASLQQQLVETQQALERDYWRLRHVETRYRLLFQVSSEAILVVDASNRRIVDANEAAGRLFDKSPNKLVGRTFPIGVDSAAEPMLEQALADARAVGRSQVVEVQLTNGSLPVEVAVSCFRQDSVSLFLVRLTAVGGGANDNNRDNADVLELLEHSPDGFVITDMEGRVTSANRAFLDMVELPGERQGHGRLISEWIGRPGADLAVFLAMVRKHGVLRLMDTALRGEHGNASQVEISVASAPELGTPSLAFIVRDVGRRVANGPQGARDLTRAVEQLTSLVGRTSLRTLLRDTTDLVERHFIEAALELTDDNRTAAAEVLGLSRQSLYVKLRRHRLAADLENQQASSST